VDPLNISKIELKNFRNYNNQTIELCKGLNLITGDNGQGKTNIVEAIYICAYGKSFRTSKDIEMIKFDENFFGVSVFFENINREEKIEISYNRNKEKRIKKNGVGITRIQEMIGELSIVLFSPEDMKLVKDSPSERRRFLDREISSLSKRYLSVIIEYSKVLDQRNNLLKQIREDHRKKETIGIWDEKISRLGALIMSMRKSYISDLTCIASKVHSKMTSDKEKLHISYTPSIKNSDDESEDGIYSKMLSGLKKSIESDIFKGYTSIGPHKDDMVFYVNGSDLKIFGSQGQKRTGVLAVKLSQVEMIKRIKGEYPILLLDDVLSELDLSRQKDILTYTKDIQTIITAAELNQEILDYFMQKSNDVSGFEYRKIKVENGVALGGYYV
jgi:DNA replication and repair protein RecF